ncbi:uncharacterized protein LOC120538928 [Polypterus senegalus]|nr:uncharacterized protein LOC120538928 [Polypterus senegalus]
MSQVGSILQLYVEVRSVPENGGNREVSMAQESGGTPATSSTTTSTHLRNGSRNGSPLQFSTRQTASPQLDLQGGSSSRTGHRHSVHFDDNKVSCGSQDSMAANAKKLAEAPTLLLRTNSDCEPFGVGCQSPVPSGRTTAPATPSNRRRGSRPEDKGWRSVVTFGYIEKARVNTVTRPFRSADGSQAGDGIYSSGEIEKPVWVKNQPSTPDTVSKMPCSKMKSCTNSFGQQVMSPGLLHRTLASIAKAATNRALEEFGSPQMRQRAASTVSWQGSQSTKQPRCKSWTGSPVLVHTSDPEPCSLPCGLPRSPALDKLSSQDYPSPQQCSSKMEKQECDNGRTKSPSTSSQVPELGGIRRSSILHRATVHSPSLQRTGEASNSPRSGHRVNFNLGDSLSQSTARAQDISPANSPEMARRLAEEATKMSFILQARNSPSPPQTHSPTENVMVDSPKPNRQFTQPNNKGCLTKPGLVASQDCQHTGSPGSMLDENVYSVSVTDPHIRDSPKMGQDHARTAKAISTAMFDGMGIALQEPRKSDKVECNSERQPDNQGSRGQLEKNPLRTTSPQLLSYHYEHYGHLNDFASLNIASKGCNTPTKNISPCLDSASPIRHDRQTASPSSIPKHGHINSPEVSSLSHECQPCREGKKAFIGFEEDQVMCLSNDTTRKSICEVTEGDSGHISKMLYSKDIQRPKSQTDELYKAQGDYEDGKTVSQLDSTSCSAELGPSLHSQKIARAKWEFLFGSNQESNPSVDKGLRGSSTTSPSEDCSTPTPPNSLLITRISGVPFKDNKDEICQPLANHSVQHVEVELVTPPPVVTGPSAKTGIIRRTIKYSETDLDAVPLRCYRETNIDEVLGEQDETDSAFSSNRSMQESSGNTTSPVGELNYDRTDEEEDLDEAINYPGGLRKEAIRRNNTIQKENGECPALKSPIILSGPRRPSEDGLDTFSRHFENIMESHRAKGTSYSSLDSEELLTSSLPVFSFDLPTLTPEIQGQICQSAKLIELSFAPLAQSEGHSLTDSAHTITDFGHSVSGNTLPMDDPPQEKQLEAVDGAEDVTTAFTSSQKESSKCNADSEAEQARADLLCMGNGDTLTNGNKADAEAAKRLAKRLYNLDGFKKSDVARHLSKNNDFSKLVAEEYLRFFNFSGMSLDQALRAFLKEFALMGETQERERVLSHFSRRYLACNPDSIPSEDGVHTLTCALMLLNTDLHGHNIGKRMSCQQFIGNLSRLNDGGDFSPNLLKALYNSIKNEKLQWTIDEEELRKSFSELADGRTDSSSRTMKRINSCGNPFLGLAQQPGALTYKQGFLVRKVHADADGKKTPRGKRGWKTFYAVLKGLILYLQKGENRPEKQLSEEDLKNAVSIHHSLAMRAADYSKRPNVFYLRTADWRVFLFQAPSTEQMQSWITRINTVAAMFSSPPFPAAIGSQKKFSRPLLPATSTRLSQEEQVQSHESRFRSISSELSELRSYAPDRKGKGREVEEFRQRDEYLEFEKTRYGTYAMLLRAKLRSGEEDLARFESRLFEGPEAEEDGLQRAHSSPTLHQETETQSTGKGKRNEGQRHSYRQAVKQ